MTQRDIIYAYSDGACRRNPGPGGWGAVVEYDAADVQEVSGGEGATTNQRMELRGAIEALAHVAERQQRLSASSALWRVLVTTDSKYVKDGITQWIKRWRRNNWMNAKRKPVANQDLWRRLDALCDELQVTWAWVKGHSGHAQNERADALATGAVPADEAYNK